MRIRGGDRGDSGQAEGPESSRPSTQSQGAPRLLYRRRRPAFNSADPAVEADVTESAGSQSSPTATRPLEAIDGSSAAAHASSASTGEDDAEGDEGFDGGEAVGEAPPDLPSGVRRLTPVSYILRPAARWRGRKTSNSEANPSGKSTSADLATEQLDERAAHEWELDAEAGFLSAEEDMGPE